MANRDINKEIEQTLGSLHGMERAMPSDRFYEKLMLRVEKKEAKVVPVAPRTLWRAAAGIALLVALNVWICLRFNKQENATAQSNNNPVAEEYFSYLKTTQF